MNGDEDPLGRPRTGATLPRFGRTPAGTGSIPGRVLERLRRDGAVETARFGGRYLERLVRAYGYLPLLRALSDDGVVWREVDGGRIALDLSDPGLSRRLLVRGEHEPAIEALWRRAIEPGMEVVDVGSNLGYYALMAAERVGPDGHVHAIEPAPSNYDLLRRSVAANDLENVSTYNLAVGSSVGTRTMYLTEESNWGTLLEWETDDRTSAYVVEKMEERTRETIEVETTTLPALVDEHGLETVDALRMDVEGYEVEVTAGMAELLRDVDSPCWAFLEVHNKHFEDHERVVAELVETYTDAGFRPHATFLGNDPVEVDDGFLETLLAHDDACPHVVFRK